MEKTNTTLKVITPTGVMSNLVGKWGIVMIEDRAKYTVFVCGKADEKHFMVQAIGALDGMPNVIRLCKIEDMLSWCFYDNAEMVESEMLRFHEKGELRHRLDLRNNRHEPRTE